MKSGIELIAAERQEQIEKHKLTLAFDLRLNDLNQLSQAASLLIGEVDFEDYDALPEEMTPSCWDESLWVKMCAKSYKERLIMAGALIAAEIDRIQALEE